MKKNSGIGGYIRGLRRRLVEAGHKPEEIDALVGGGGKTAALRFPAAFKKSLEVAVRRDGKAIVTLGGSGKLRVYSFEGYAKVTDNVNAGRAKRHGEKKEEAAA